MAKLYFRHGAMGSSKTANALMVEYNYYERGKHMRPSSSAQSVESLGAKMEIK